jgi:hypothetical protein
LFSEWKCQPNEEWRWKRKEECQPNEEWRWKRREEGQPNEEWMGEVARVCEVARVSGSTYVR